MASQIDNRAPVGSLFKKPREKRQQDFGRSPRQENPKHLEAIRKLPCVACGHEPCDAAHVRRPSAAHGKRATGMQEKPDDKWTVPLCRKHHDEQHRVGELQFWYDLEVSPYLLCIDLYRASPNIELMRKIVAERQF